jgi:adenine-specific DNA-methyltransferase
MEKLKLHSPNIVSDNIDRIAELFPNCVTEAQAEDGTIQRRIDFDLLRQELSEQVVDGPKERYQLNWPGKKEAILAANSPIAKTLRPCREESVEFDKTRNLFIEGDNLEVLKLLRETYLGKVKVIYIDPPYNTGKDFIYRDDYAETPKEYFLRSEQRDASGSRMFANSEANGRFHSDWLSMMYCRLRVSRDLLSESGIIFMSIDDGELDNLIKLTDEIFGEGNHVATVVVKRASEIASNHVVSKHEYLVVYARDISQLKITGTEKQTISRATVGNIDQTMPVIEFPAGLECHDVIDGCYNTLRQLENSRENIENLDPVVVKDGKLERSVRLKARWRSSNDMRAFFANGCRPTKSKISGFVEKIFFKGDRFMPQIVKKTFEKIPSIIDDISRGSKDLEDLQLAGVMDFPKPVALLKHLFSLPERAEGDLYMDFFSGSATTAHSLIQLNAEDGGNRKFIMVQLPEVCAEGSAAFSAGYKTIAEIGKERIRRAGEKIIDEDYNPTWNKDIGFRVLKVDSSNMNDVYYTPKSVNQGDLFAHVDNIKEDRTPEDLLFQVLLDTGTDLTLPIAAEMLQGKRVFFVNEDDLAACFETGISEAIVHEIAARRPLKAVFRDSGFDSDSTKINVEQIFKLKSPRTKLKVI